MPSVSNMTGVAPEKVVSDKAGRTFGKPNGASVNHPGQYMQKGAHTGKVMTLSEATKNMPDVLKPTNLKPSSKPVVPRAKDAAPVMNLVTAKNFVVANAVETILAAPKRPAATGKDYLRKEDYGKPPKYLEMIKQDIDAEYDYIRQLQQEHEELQNSNVRPLEEEERLQLIDGLKAKWEQVNTEYQGSTHITKLDSNGKVRRKEKWESTLANIEKDIEKLNKKNIVINSWA